MSKILVLESSPQQSESFSNKLSQNITEKLLKKNPQSTVKTRNLIANPPPLLTKLEFGAYSDQAIEELFDADTVILNIPMHNFSIPSVLKAWIDQIARAGKTFSYSAAGAEGLLKNKKVYLAIATGGVFSSGPYKDADFIEPYVRAVFGFLGMSDVTTFRIEGLAVPGLKETALENAFELVRI